MTRVDGFCLCKALLCKLDVTALFHGNEPLVPQQAHGPADAWLAEIQRGIDQQHIDIVRHSGIDLERWLGGFESVESSVHETVRRLKEHPLMPKDVRISGFIMDSATGELTRVEA